MGPSQSAALKRSTIQLGICGILLWIFRLELAQLLPDRSTPAGKIFESRCFRLGWSSDVSRRLH